MKFIQRYLLEDDRVQAKHGHLLSNRTNARKVISLVESGSFDDAILLSNSFLWLDDSQLSEALSALLNFTKHMHPPTSEPLDCAVNEIDDIKISYSIISAISTRFQYASLANNDQEIDSMCSVLPPHFDRILSWIRYFAQNHVGIISIVNKTIPRFLFVVRLCTVFGCFTVCKSAGNFCYSLDAFRLAMELWLMERKDDFGDLGTAASAELLIKFLSKMIHNRIEAHFQEVLCDHADNAFHLAICRLKRLLYRTSPMHVKLEDLLCIIFGLRPHIELHHRLLQLQHDFIWSTISASHSLLDRSNLSSTSRLMLIRCMEEMPLFMYKTDGFRCLLKAVRSGFLDLVRRVLIAPELSVLDCTAPQLALLYFNEELVLYGFIDAIPGDIGAVHREARNAESNGWKDTRADWDVFRGMVYARFALKTMYDQWLKRKKTMCNNCKIRTGSRMLMCAGCQDAFYCSEACQLVSWKKSGHREACKEMKAQLEGVYPKQWTTRRDREFLQVVATMDIRRFSESLLTLAKSRLPKTPPHNIIFSIDYSTFPAELDVFDIVDVLRDSSTRVPTEQIFYRPESLDAVDSTGCAGQFILVTTPAVQLDLQHRTTLMRPRFMNGMNFEVPRLRRADRGRQTCTRIAAGTDAKRQCDLRAVFDELDEAIYRLRDSTFEEAWMQMDGVLRAMGEHEPDWPFEPKE